MPVKKIPQKNKVYWWNDSVKEARKKCIKARRKYTRRRRVDAGSSVTIALHGTYADARKELSEVIQDSKKRNWKAVCAELEEAYGALMDIRL